MFTQHGRVNSGEDSARGSERCDAVKLENSILIEDQWSPRIALTRIDSRVGGADANVLTVSATGAHHIARDDVGSGRWETFEAFVNVVAKTVGNFSQVDFSENVRAACRSKGCDSPARCC